MIKNIIYAISIISLCFITYLFVQMLPIIVQSGWQGIIFFFSTILLLITELIILLDKNQVKEFYSYNIFIILLAMYLSLIYYKIYSINPTSISLYYNIDIKFCQRNYLIITIAFIMTICHVYLLRKEKKGG